MTTQTELADALQAGAEFIVTPVLNEAVIHDCNKLGVPVIPGAFTPTEIFKAWSAGGTMVKIFPAASLGLQFIKDVRGPLNNIPLMPTGGIDHKNVNAFFKAGASVVGVGSRLFDLAMIKEKNWNGLINHFMTFANAVRRT
ncbi:MAG: bifunctional 4-hydroxy-2-oxoglutarate aldolase/2-dehydro-3-deoxy-phosphogluconate aldolase [Bacteroidetes bacterium]|nr:bifunctional 4-hydroxy-2-oxoglutarate aldolase/2-dehydro-3-deoxy-phosphogluconate aldolase [Bacteroidota bacterium]